MLIRTKVTHTGIYARGRLSFLDRRQGVCAFGVFACHRLPLYPAHNTCMDHGSMQANYIAGTPYLGSSTTMYPGPGGYQGELVAWDVANAKQVWGIKDADLPVLQRCAGHRRRSGLLRNHGG